jgi:hypothetical protein
VINLGVTLLFFVLAPLLRPHVDGRPWLRRLLARFIAFETYYRENPPRIFLYYVFYPVLFPYWLFVRKARREFALYRGLSLLALLILVGSAVYQYVTKWRPEIPFHVFFLVFGTVFVFQCVIVLALMMPLATTVVGYHLGGKNKRLVILLVATCVSIAGAIAIHAHRRHDAFPAMTMARMNARTVADPHRAGKTLALSVIAAARKVKELGPAALDLDVGADAQEIRGAPLDDAHEALTAFYKDDEASAFDLVWFGRAPDGPTIVLFVPNGNRAPLWVASNRHKVFAADEPELLPPGAIDRMRSIAQK